LLGKSLIKKLSERSWEKALEGDSNPTQTWTRTRSKAERALKHLTILANTLPDDKQEQIFSVENVRILLDSILRQPVWATSSFDTLDERRSKVAAAIAEIALNKCIDHFKKVEESEDIRNLVIEHIKASIGLCTGIARKRPIRR
jgi:hypothetical protein